MAVKRARFRKGVPIAVLLLAVVSSIVVSSILPLTAKAKGWSVIDRVSVSSTGSAGNKDSFYASISADGRYVTFSSDASNLVWGDTNETADVFVFDRLTRRTERVSVSSWGFQGNGDHLYPSISADGRYVAFISDAANLTPGDRNKRADVFVYDRKSERIQRVTESRRGAEGNADSAFPCISADGSCVAFVSGADNIVPGDLNDV